jgi:hypothetical protein
VHPQLKLVIIWLQVSGSTKMLNSEVCIGTFAYSRTIIDLRYRKLSLMKKYENRSCKQRLELVSGVWQRIRYLTITTNRP